MWRKEKNIAIIKSQRTKSCGERYNQWFAKHVHFTWVTMNRVDLLYPNTIHCLWWRINARALWCKNAAGIWKRQQPPPHALVRGNTHGGILTGDTIASRRQRSCEFEIGQLYDRRGTWYLGQARMYYALPVAVCLLSTFIAVTTFFSTFIPSRLSSLFEKDGRARTCIEMQARAVMTRNAYNSRAIVTRKITPASKKSMVNHEIWHNVPPCPPTVHCSWCGLSIGFLTFIAAIVQEA